MKCPNCGAPIKRFDISENCKHCGINLFYSQQEDFLSRDAKKCELEFASFRVLVSKLKAAFIRGKLPISRLVFSVICVAVLLIPFASVSLNLPLVQKSLSFSGLGLYNAFSDGTLMALLDFLKLPVSKGIATISLVLIGVIVLIALCAVAILLLEILSFINLEKTARGLKIVSLIAVVLSVVSAIVAALIASHSANDTLSCSFGFGAIACAIVYFVMFFINATILKKGVKLDVSDIDLKRIELYKKVKKGEVSLDDLPLPVFDEPKKEPVEKEKKKFGRRKKK